MSENPSVASSFQGEPTPNDLKLVLVRLQSWPDLSEVPAYKQVRVARICALLSRKPTAGHLIPRVLGEDEGEVMDAVLDMLRADYVSYGSQSPAGPEAAMPGNPAMPAPAVPAETPAEPAFQPPKRSLISKLWAKLLS